MKETKAKIVREMLSKGISPKEAASLSGAALQYVYDIKSKMNYEAASPIPKIKEEEKPAKPAVTLPDDVLKAIRDQEEEIKSLKNDIASLCTVVEYLEYRLKTHGAAI
jgi:DNA invertase Pin-like site-specific DNA recombinase